MVYNYYYHDVISFMHELVHRIHNDINSSFLFVAYKEITEAFLHRFDLLCWGVHFVNCSLFGFLELLRSPIWLVGDSLAEVVKLRYSLRTAAVGAFGSCCCCWRSRLLCSFHTLLGSARNFGNRVACAVPHWCSEFGVGSGRCKMMTWGEVHSVTVFAEIVGTDSGC